MLTDGRLEEIESLEQRLDVDRPPTAMEIDLTFKAIEELLADRAALAAEVERLKAVALSDELMKDLRDLVDGGDHETAEGLLAALFDDIASLKEEAAQVERLAAERAWLRAAVAALADEFGTWADTSESLGGCYRERAIAYRACALSAAGVAAAEPRPAGETEGTAR